MLDVRRPLLERHGRGLRRISQGSLALPLTVRRLRGRQLGQGLAALPREPFRELGNTLVADEDQRDDGAPAPSLGRSLPGSTPSAFPHPAQLGAGAGWAASTVTGTPFIALVPDSSSSSR